MEPSLTARYSCGKGCGGSIQESSTSRLLAVAGKVHLARVGRLARGLIACQNLARRSLWGREQRGAIADHLMGIDDDESQQDHCGFSVEGRCRLACGISPDSLMMILRHARRIVGPPAKAAYEPVKTRFFRPGRLRAVGSLAIFQHSTFTGCAVSLGPGRKQRQFSDPSG